MTATTEGVIRPGFQTIYDRDGKPLIKGQWDSRALYKAITPGGDDYWQDKSVLDIGANSAGLTLELARAGAYVLALEPDPYGNNLALARPTLDRIIADEGLSVNFADGGLFDAHRLGHSEVVLCLGLLYHFRDPQYVLDYLSTLDLRHLILSAQTHPGDGLLLVNRKDESSGLPATYWANHRQPLSGWHPTRPLLQQMLEAAGFAEVVPLTDPTVNFPDKPLPGVTNSAYYRATKSDAVEPDASRRVYLPR